MGTSDSVGKRKTKIDGDPATKTISTETIPTGTISVESDNSIKPIDLARALFRDKVTLFALTFLMLLLIAAIGAEFIAPYDPARNHLALRNKPPLTPSATERGFPHLLGTDPLGRDVLSRIIFGARVSLTVGFASVLASGTIGVLIGLLSGYYRGRFDAIAMRIVDVAIGFPTLLAAMFILFTIGPGFWNVVIVLALVRWMIYARVTRSMTISYREAPFVESARALGCSDARIIFKHIMPNLFSPILVLATLEIAGVILAEASLSFLGFGVQPPTPSWGVEVSNGREYVRSAWWLVTFPGLIILLTTLSLNLLATWLRAINDPVHRWRWLMGTVDRGAVAAEATGMQSRLERSSAA
jgi:peptide/nickel transport system permease protein